ncbi:MAG: GNAT family N-acetyltransferase [Bacillota bacterium]|nr:GNAT family N-acetyltransferase [Bacillota bacterium]
MEIRQLSANDLKAITGAAVLLLDAFPHSWPTAEIAEAEVMTCLEEGKVALVAVNRNEVVGFIGAMPQYDTTGWELHPLVVARACQRQGIGRQLVQALEAEVARLGGITIYLGSDDEFGKTSLSGCDLYDHLWERINTIQNIKDHPYAFYQKMGYQIVGVIPDANGFGKPDIWLARRIRLLPEDL